MILVLSFDVFEQGTDPVIDWLIYYKAPFIKLSINDLVQNNSNCYIDVNTDTVYVNGVAINDQVKVIWYRRFFHDFNLPVIEDQKNHDKLNRSAKTELNTLFFYLAKIFKDKIWMPSYEGHQLNKFQALQQARESGLAIPLTRIINNKKQLLEFLNLNAHCGLITKAFTDDSKGYYIKQNEAFFSFTKEITAEDTLELPAYFFPSLFQEKLDIDYEIRVFYLDGECFATAIINTGSGGFADRKLYNKSVFTHQLAYQLPEELRLRIDNFMQQVDLNTGCLDIARTKAGEYYFIEVNPVGQYLYQSVKCNYQLEHKIAKWLIKNDDSFAQKEYADLKIEMAQ
jgi:glutathione synthase/RimK-type ligase-like ATP-grasp enzyme